MVEHTLSVIPEPRENTRVVFRRPTNKQPHFYNGSPEFFVCGNCKFALVFGMRFEEIDREIRSRVGNYGGGGIVIQCLDCKALMNWWLCRI